MLPGITYTTVRGYSRKACDLTQKLQKIRITGVILERRLGEEDKVMQVITRPTSH